MLMGSAVVIEEQVGDELKTLLFMVEIAPLSKRDMALDMRIEISPLRDHTSEGSTRLQHDLFIIEGTAPALTSSYPSSRRPLFTFCNPFLIKLYDCGYGVSVGLNSEEKEYAASAVQKVSRSILELFVEPRYGRSLCLTIMKKARTKFRFWLARMPSILQQDPNWMNVSEIPFKSDEDESETPDDGKANISLIVDSYPDIQFALMAVAPRCHCGCVEQVDEGCLQSIMLAEIVLLVGHSLADAAGASDISNLRGRETGRDLLDATSTLLTEVVRNGEIRWQTWFLMDSIAITGFFLRVIIARQELGMMEDVFCYCVGPITVVPS